MKIFIVCSKHFYDRVEKIKDFLELKGHKITLPNSFDDPMKEEKMKKMSVKDHIKWKSSMMKKQVRKIKVVDAILVLNFEKKGIPNYVGGGATFMEIIKAWELNKKIFFYNSLPNCSFTDELTAINPIMIKGDLSRI